MHPTRHVRTATVTVSVWGGEGGAEEMRGCGVILFHQCVMIVAAGKCHAVCLLTPLSLVSPLPCLLPHLSHP